ncbi:dTDP-4-dehydrorhamnose reductase [compost metagenome]
MDDQHGCPTSARDIAAALKTIALRMIGDDQAPVGVFHFVNAGETSWAGLAREIFARSAATGGPSAAVEGITTADYPTQARRPANSRLMTSRLTRDYGVVPRAWQDAVAEIVFELNAERAPA